MNNVLRATCIETLSATGALQGLKSCRYFWNVLYGIKLAKLCSNDEIL